MKKELKISTVTVKIQVVTIDGKRMSKAVFNQINFEDAFNECMNFDGDQILGYVKNEHFDYLLWTWNGQLFKTPLTNLLKFSAIKITDGNLNDFKSGREWNSSPHYGGLYNILKLIFKNNITEIVRLQDIAIEIIAELEDNQLYIAI